jgi:hypothetical protein
MLGLQAVAKAPLWPIFSSLTAKFEKIPIFSFQDGA